MKNILFMTVLGLLLVVGGGYYYMQMSDMSAYSGQKNNIMVKDAQFITEDGEVIHLDEEMEVSDSMKLLVSDADTLTGTLDDVSGGNSTGTAYLLRKNGKLLHFVEGQMPKPAEDSVYEGWLVNRSNGVKFFSTGVMKETADGVYTLAYESDELSEGYDFVVITEETVVDETPEAHIIEGTVQ